MNHNDHDYLNPEGDGTDDPSTQNGPADDPAQPDTEQAGEGVGGNPPEGELSSGTVVPGGGDGQMPSYPPEAELGVDDAGTPGTEGRDGSEPEGSEAQAGESADPDAGNPFPPEDSTPETTEMDPARQLMGDNPFPPDTTSTESEMSPFTPPPEDPDPPETKQPRTTQADERPRIHRVSSPVGEHGVQIERDADITPQTCPYAFSGVNLASMRRAQLRKVFKGLGFDPDPQMSKQELLKVLISKINSGEVMAEPAE